MLPTNSIQVWKIIEQDFTLRLSLVANEWATEHLKAWNAVFAEARRRGNAAYCGPALVEMEIADADKRGNGPTRPAAKYGKFKVALNAGSFSGLFSTGACNRCFRAKAALDSNWNLLRNVGG